MNCFTYGTDIFHITIGREKGIIHVKALNSELEYGIEAPVFEIEGEELELYPAGEVQVINERSMANGGKEVILGCSIEHSNPIRLNIYLQFFPESPFIRYRYEIHTQVPAKLTKINGRDNIRYAGLSFDYGEQKVTELQFSHFNPAVHSYQPNLELKNRGELVQGCSYPGPVTLVEGKDRCLLLAYEHGAEYPDTHISFHTQIKDDKLGLTVSAVKGNYYHGEIIDEKHTFVTPWFHMAAVQGDSNELFRHYRTFLLNYICENREARKPYIYYNTWNYQERNSYYNGKKYLDSMNLDRMLKEIDVAYRMGVDVFVIDTGWFGKAGDWYVNTERFPDGLLQVKQKLSGYGMKLGLWFNPTAAAATSKTYHDNIDHRITQDGRGVSNIVWETEECYFMCLASGYADVFVKKMLELHDLLGVTYFKWDGIHQYGCDSPFHNHGNEANSKEERLDCYSYKMGMEMIRIVEEVTKQCPEIIVDFDVTEEGRFVGLGFLSVGKYFLVNNGPYAMDFDLPEKFEAKSNQVAVNLNPYTNMFFFPGPARSRFCRQGVNYDFFAPSILFLAHFLPDAPVLSQNNSLASIVLGSNGIWGDLMSLSEEDVQLFADTLARYKEVAQYATESYPVTRGYTGSSPEIYEKIEPQASKGLLCFFTHVKGSYTYITQRINTEEFSGVYGADSYELTEDGRIKLTVELDENDARIVFVK